MATCQECFTIELPSCTLKILILPESGLSPDTDYKIVIKDKFGNRYQLTVITDENGFIEFDVADFPEGLFTPYSGSFELTIIESRDTTCVPLPLTFCDVEYECISFSFYKVTTEDEVAAAIKCCDSSGGGGDTALCNRIYSEYFNTVVAQVNYSQPNLQGKEIVMVQYGTQTLEPSQYSYAGTTLTFTYPPDQVLRTVVFYKNICP